MATLNRWPGPQELTRLRGIVQIIHDRGVIVARRWPRRRPGVPTPRQALARAAFARLTAVVMATDRIDRDGAKAIAAGTGWTWRDVLSAASAGTLIEVEGMTAPTIQRYLDSISQTIGSILYRSPLGWIPLTPQMAGDILALSGDGVTPEWITPATPGAGAVTLISTLTMTANTSVSWTGLSSDIYDYLLTWRGDPTETTQVATVQFGTGEPITWQTSGYTYARPIWETAGYTGFDYSNTTSAINVASTTGQCLCIGPVLTGTGMGYDAAAGADYVRPIGGRWHGGSTIQGIILSVPSGALPDGTASLYSVTK